MLGEENIGVIAKEHGHASTEDDRLAGGCVDVEGFDGFVSVEELVDVVGETLLKQANQFRLLWYQVRHNGEGNNTSLRNNAWVCLAQENLVLEAGVGLHKLHFLFLPRQRITQSLRTKSHQKRDTIINAVAHYFQ